MPRKCLLLGLLLLALGTALGLALQWPPSTPQRPAPPPAGGAQGGADAADGDFHRGETTPGPSATNDGTATVRLAMPDEAQAAASRTLEVRVVARRPDGGIVRVPFVDVALEVDQDSRTRSIARTDQTGCARFVFRDAPGHRVDVTAGIGGSASATLVPAGEGSADQTLELKIAPRAVALGTVVDRGGRAVADADLVLLHWADGGDDGPLWRVGRSAADGSFRVPVAVGGRLGAVAAMHSPSALHLLRNGQDPARPLEQSFELVLFGEAATVRGVVVDGDGRAIVGARIGFDSLEQRPAGSERTAPPQRVTADAQGEFVAEGLRPGLLAISAWADDFGWLQDEVRVAPDGEAFVTLRLPWPSRVIGVVETATGAAVPGARVTGGVAGTWLRVSARADEAGRFALPGLGSGPVALRATDGARSVQTELDLEPGSSREWRAVLDDGDGDGPVLRGVVLDADERPCADWRVVVRGDGKVRGARTGYDGAFAVRAPAAAGLDVRAFAAGRQLTGFADALVRGVEVGPTPLRLVVDRAPTATLRARVSAQDHGGPLPAVVEAWHHERAEYARFAATADGVLAIDRVPAGTVDLTFEHAGYARRAVRDRGVAAGAADDLGVIALDRAGSLFGTVRGPGGAVPEACQLTIAVDGQLLSAEYAAGIYRFASVPAGALQLRVQGPGLGAVTFRVELRAGEDLERNLELEPGLRRRFVVTAPQDAHGDVHLALLRGDDQVLWVGTGKLGAGTGGPPQTTFVAHMTGGSYRVRAWIDRGPSADGEVQFRYDDEPDVTLTLR